MGGACKGIFDRVDLRKSASIKHFLRKFSVARPSQPTGSERSLGGLIFTPPQIRHTFRLSFRGRVLESPSRFSQHVPLKNRNEDLLRLGAPPACATHLRRRGVPLGDATVDSFPDGETFVKINENIRGRDVFLVQPTCPPTNQNLMELLIMVDAAKRASAARITAVIPFFGYARQDRKDQPRVPITAKLVANLLTAAGVDRVLTMDLHAQQVAGFFDIPVDHLYAAPVLIRYLRKSASTIRPSSRRMWAD